MTLLGYINKKIHSCQDYELTYVILQKHDLYNNRISKNASTRLEAQATMMINVETYTSCNIKGIICLQKHCLLFAARVTKKNGNRIVHDGYDFMMIV